MRKTLILLFASLLCMSAGGATPPQVCPEPVSVRTLSPDYFPLSTVSVSCPDKTAREWAESHLKEWYGLHAPKVESARSNSAPMDKEAYRMECGKNGVRITAGTLQGVRYALYTLRQIAVPKRGTLKVEGYKCCREGQAVARLSVRQLPLQYGWLWNKDDGV